VLGYRLTGHAESNPDSSQLVASDHKQNGGLWASLPSDRAVAWVFWPICRQLIHRILNWCRASPIVTPQN